MPLETKAPILNEYKYRLTRRRLLQTISGGVKIQRLPYYIHIIQWIVWSVPILIYCPFIGGLLVWNEYYIGGIYSITCSLLVLTSGVFVKMLYYRETLAVREEDDDEAEDDINIPSCISYKTLHLLSTRKHFMNIIMHCIISGLICYSSFIILNPFFMKSILPLPVIPFIFTTGAISLCIAHYSLISTPMEIISYRPHHQDWFQLRFLRRPIYIIILGMAFIILRYLVLVISMYSTSCRVPST